MKNRETDFVLPFNEVKIEDIPLVGGKNASLGEMYRELKQKGVEIPNGFAVTAFAYKHFMSVTGLKEKIKDLLLTLNTKDTQNLMAHGKKVREEILKAKIPEEIEKEIIYHYKKL